MEPVLPPQSSPTPSADSAINDSAADALGASPAEMPETLPPEIPAAVPVPMNPLLRVYHGAAFALSAVLSPYLVIPIGTVGIVASQELARGALWRWTLMSIFFSTGVPALYVVWQVLAGKISDVHVMEREQRGGPFLVAIFSSALGALAMKLFGAAQPIWALGVVLSVNGVIMLWITTFWKISIHVAVLSATVFASLFLIPGIPKWQLLLLIPALMWARVTRGRHSIWQGISGCAVAGVVTMTVLYGLRFVYKISF